MIMEDTDKESYGLGKDKYFEVLESLKKITTKMSAKGKGEEERERK